MKHIGYVLITICLVSVLVGCVPDQQQDPIVLQYNNANTRLNACVDNLNTLVEHNPEYAPLIPYGILASWNGYTIGQLSDTSYISVGDSQLVENYLSARLQCMTQYANDLSTVDARFSEVVERDHQLTEQNDQLLLQRKETWGQFSTNREQIGSGYQAAMGSVIQEKNAEYEQANNLAVQQQQQALAAFSNFMQNQELINAAEQPKIFNCTSNHFGNEVTTTCY